MLILKEVRSPSGRPRQKRGREPGPGGPCSRHLKGAPRREQGGRGRGIRQKFAASSALEGPARGASAWPRSWGGRAGSPRLGSARSRTQWSSGDPDAATRGLAALAGHRVPGLPGGPSCAARKQRRPRGESARDASRPAPTERACVPASEQATLSPVPPTARRAVARSGCSGHPGYCFGPAAAPDPRGTSGLPHARPGAQRAGPVGTELMGSSPAPRKVAPRGGGGGWWAEAVGGGGGRPPISPKSKVLGGAVSRAPETRLPPPLPPPPARQSAPLRRAATPSACLVAAACAPGRVRLGAGRGGCSQDLPQGGGPDPGPWRSSAPGRTHPPAAATASRRTQSSAIRPSSPGAGGPCHPAPTADSPLPPPFSLPPTPLPIPMPPPQPGSLGRRAHSD